MKSKTKEALPVAIKRARRQFEAWRAQKRGRERIPERLWSAAVSAARLHGVHAVSQGLGLNAGDLKRRVEESVGDAVEVGEAPFMEMVVGVDKSAPSCVVELEKGNGTRMRICVRDTATIDWARMKEAFLGA